MRRLYLCIYVPLLGTKCNRWNSYCGGWRSDDWLTMTFEEVSGGTEVTLVFENLPPGLRAEDNEAGSRLSLEQLARRFE